MRSLWPRLVRHAIVVGVILAIIGHFLGRAFLIAHRVYGGGAHDPQNDRVLWQTPVVMAGLGVALTVGMDLLMFVVRRPAQAALPPTA